MKNYLLKITLLIILAVSLGSCASGYKTLTPSSLKYRSSRTTDGVTVAYKYDLLKKKYKKKSEKKGVQMVAVKITNNSDRNLTFGKDFTLNYSGGGEVDILDPEDAFAELRQQPASYLWYLLLAPVTFSKTETTNGITTSESTFPIGLILGPGIAGGNMIASSSANGKLKKQLMDGDLYNRLIAKGSTEYGIIAIESDTPEGLVIKMK